MQLACSADETKLWLSPLAIVVLGPHLCTRIQVRSMIGLLKVIVIVYLPIKVKENSKCSSGNSLSPLGARTRILVLLRRCYEARLNYGCNRRHVHC